MAIWTLTTHTHKQNQPPIPLRTNIHRSPPLALDDPDKLPCIHSDVITTSHTLWSWCSSEVTDGEARYRGGQLSERLPRLHPASSSCSSSALGCPPTPIMGLICAPLSKRFLAVRWTWRLCEIPAGIKLGGSTLFDRSWQLLHMRCTQGMIHPGKCGKQKIN